MLDYSIDDFLCWRQQVGSLGSSKPVRLAEHSFCHFQQVAVPEVVAIDSAKVVRYQSLRRFNAGGSDTQKVGCTSGEGSPHVHRETIVQRSTAGWSLYL